MSESYWAQHKRVHRALGKASVHQCVRCPAQAAEWAQVHTEDGSNPETDYVPMCVSCHRQYDKINRTDRWYVWQEINRRRVTQWNYSRVGVSLPPAQRSQVLAAMGIKPKLTADQVRGCRARHAAGERNRDLAREFKMSESAMHQAIHGQTYRWVKA